MKRSDIITRTTAMIINESDLKSSQTIVYTLREFICENLQDIELWRDIVKCCIDRDPKRWQQVVYQENHKQNPF